MMYYIGNAAITTAQWQTGPNPTTVKVKPPTKAWDEKQILNAVSDGVSQGQVDKRFDFQMIH